MNPSPLRLSCADYTWPGLRHATALAVIADIGFEGVDLGLFGDSTHTKLSPLLADPDGYRREVAARVEQAGLVVADVFLTPDPDDLAHLAPTSPDPDEREESCACLSAALRFAAELGAPGVTLLPGVVHDGQSWDDAVELAARWLRRAVQEATALGLRLSFEPHVGSITDTPQRAAELVRSVPGLQITLDPGHFVFAGAQLDDIMTLAPDVGHVQLRAGGVSKMQPRWEDNDIDFARVIRELSLAGYRGWLASEYVAMAKWDCDRVDNLTQTIKLKNAMEQHRRAVVR